MPDALCLPHKNRGAQVPAAKIVDGTPMCADCFAGKEILAAPSRFSEASIHSRDEDPKIKPAGKSLGWRANAGPKTSPVKPEEKKNMPKERKDLDWITIQN